MENKGYYNTSAIAEMTGGIILANYEKTPIVQEEYQSESKLEQNLISNLLQQGYERFYGKDNNDLKRNLRIQIEKLNKLNFTDSEWERFLKEYLDKPNDGMIEKTRKIQENSIYDFEFDSKIVSYLRF